MALGRVLLSSTERKKFRILLTVETFVLVAMVSWFTGPLSGYRYFDLFAAPAFVYVAASQLGSAKAMEHIWFAVSPRIVFAMLCVSALFGFSVMPHNAILQILAEGVFIGLLAMAVMGEEPENVSGLGTVFRIGFGLGFGLRFGFVFGLLAFGLFAIGFYGGALVGNVLTSRFWKQLKNLPRKK